MSSLCNILASSLIKLQWRQFNFFDATEVTDAKDLGSSPAVFRVSLPAPRSCLEGSESSSFRLPGTHSSLFHDGAITNGTSIGHYIMHYL